jgi:hypothetical protein
MCVVSSVHRERGRNACTHVDLGWVSHALQLVREERVQHSIRFPPDARYLTLAD